MATVGGPAQLEHAAGDHVCWVIDAEQTKRIAVFDCFRGGLGRGVRLLYVADQAPYDIEALVVVAGRRSAGPLRGRRATLVSASTSTGRGWSSPGRSISPTTSASRPRSGRRPPATTATSCST